MIQACRFNWLIAIVILALAAAAAPAAVVITTVRVGDAGNAGEQSRLDYGDATYYGGVADVYNMGKYEVTAGQYRDFLNAVDSTGTNSLGLYNPFMNGWACCQITLNSSAPDGSKYDFSGAPSGTASDWENRPVNYVSFWDAVRFANWLHNDQGNGDTESGAYHNVGDHTLFGRNSGARFFIPTVDEWYKAAYYDPTLNSGTGGYYDYPTMSDIGNPPSNDLDGGGNNATFGDGDATIGYPYYRTTVGAHINSPSTYGTFDQGGNVREWNETAFGSYHRFVKGGSFCDWDYTLLASQGYVQYPTDEFFSIGFRVASSAAVPEPGSIAMWTGLALMGLIWWRRRK